MRISLRWLNRYVPVTLSPEELAHALTMVGLEVESVERPGEKYDHFVVGSVVAVSKHPNADRLSVTKVNVGQETLQIVCGAPNVAPGQSVAVGLPGAVVPKNQHDPNGHPFTLTRAKVRGEESFGMICSAYELDLGDDKSGIMLLDGSPKPGTPLALHLGLDDTVMEVGITPNRPDAMSHVGIAREVAAIVGKRLTIPKPAVRHSTRSAASRLRVRVEAPDECPRYAARVILGTKVITSPEWLKQALQAVGLRPINAIVDVTNYVLMEIGQPLHAFDYDALEGATIIVRTTKEGEKFTTLDGKERSMRGGALMICDGARPVAVAGVMGGLNSEITPSTVNIVLESAYFQPASIRKTSKHLGLTSDASQRFERGADPNICLWAVDRAAALIQEIAGGEVLKGVIDIYPRKIRPREVILRPKKVNEILGVSLAGTKISALLRKIGMTPTASRGALRVAVPTFRPDIEREIDLIEEVARIHGYNNIETAAKSFATPDARPSADPLQEMLRKWLLGSGYAEVVANSMCEPNVAGLGSDRVVRIANPISKEMGALRTSLIPGMVAIVRNNFAHGSKDLRLYEIGRSYHLTGGGERGRYLERYLEKEELLLAFTGAASPHAWDMPERQIDIFDVKGELDTLFRKIFLDKINYIPYSNGNTLTQTGLTIEIAGETAGSLGAVRKEIKQKFDLDAEMLVAVLDVEVLRKHARFDRRYVALPRFPAVRRDVAFVVDRAVPVGEIERCIRASVHALSLQVALFDIYTGDQLPPQKKSCAFALEFLSREHTLGQAEIDQVMQTIIGNVSKTFQASIRA